MKATIYYFSHEKTTRDERWEMYEGKCPGREKYEEVGTFEVRANHTGDALEELFERFNVGDHGGKRIRSMSVGDVVTINGESFFCASVGWTPIASF